MFCCKVTKRIISLLGVTRQIFHGGGENFATGVKGFITYNFKTNLCVGEIFFHLSGEICLSICIFTTDTSQIIISGGGLALELVKLEIISDIFCQVYNSWHILKVFRKKEQKGVAYSNLAGLCKNP